MRPIPPLQVLVEYAPAEVDAFIAFADAVEEEFAGIHVDGTEVGAGPPASRSLPPWAAPCLRVRAAHAPTTHAARARARAPMPTLRPPLSPHPHHAQVDGRPGAFDVRLEDGSAVFSRDAAAGLPDYSDLFARLRQAGLQAAA